MSIFADDFESYSVGDQPPFGGWIVAPSANVFTKINAGGPYPSTKYFTVFLNDVLHEDPIPLSSFSTFFHYNPAVFGTIFRWVNGFYPFVSNSAGTTILFLVVEPDSSLSVYGGNNVFIGNTLFPQDFNRWPYLQINIILTSVTVSGVDYVQAQVKLVVDGFQFFDKTVNTLVTVNSLHDLMPTVNRFVFSTAFNGTGFDNFSYDTLQSIPSFPAAGSPKGRFTQGIIEALIEPDNSKIRLTQGIIETLLEPSNAKARFTQGIIELVASTGVIPSSGGWRIHEI